MMLKTYKYRLYPSKAQRRLLEQMVETCRRWDNTCLAERKTAWETEKCSITKFAQLAHVKDYRKDNPYAGQVHRHVLPAVVADLDQAFQAFFRRVQAGEIPGYPCFKGCHCVDSFGVKEYANGYRVDGQRLHLSGIGRIRVRWHRSVVGRIKTVRKHRQAGEWQACLVGEVAEQFPPPTEKVGGIDVGIHHLLATSENEVVDNSRWHAGEQRNLRVLRRQVVRRKKGGSNRRKAVLDLHRQHFYGQPPQRFPGPISPSFHHELRWHRPGTSAYQRAGSPYPAQKASWIPGGVF